MDLMAFQFIRRFLSFVLFLTVAFEVSSARAEQLSDLAEVVGARDNQLVGYGVVTGLNGTGDDIRSRVAEQTLRSLLRRLGVQVDDRALRFRNVAAVLVTATIPPFSRSGTKLDVTVSSIGNARSLTGGVLVQAPMRGADRVTYAVAQGSLVVGGFSAMGRSGSSFQSNLSTTARIPGGALVEREIPTQVISDGDAPSDGDAEAKGGAKKDASGKSADKKDKDDEKAEPKEPKIIYSLRSPDFVTAQRVALAINQALGGELAEAVDGGAVTVKLADEFKKNPVPLLAKLATVEVEPHQPARVIVNERTGTIVAGGDVRLTPVAIAQGGINISIYEQFDVSQPNPFSGSGGRTVARPRSDLSTQEREVPLKFVAGAANLNDVATVLGALGVTPRELGSILQALRAAGALRAEVIIQ
jgi:flagellar P-ring protein FlgI